MEFLVNVIKKITHTPEAQRSKQKVLALERNWKNSLRCPFLLGSAAAESVDSGSALAKLSVCYWVCDTPPDKTS